MAKNIVVGNVYSKTNWTALLVIILGYLQLPAVHESLLPFVDGKYLALGNMIVGLILIVMRNLTTESVADKGDKVLAKKNG